MISSVAVIGLGRFELVMARKLQASDVDMLAIDEDTGAVQHAAGSLCHVVRTDAASRRALEQLAVGDFNAAVVTVGGGLAASILVAPALLSLGGPGVWAKAANPQQDEIFGQMGITHVFYPEVEIGRRAAHLMAQSFADYMDLGHGLALVIATPDPKCCRATLGEPDMYRREGFSIVVIHGEDGERSTAYAGIVLREDGLVMVVAPVKTITRITRGRK